MLLCFLLLEDIVQNSSHCPLVTRTFQNMPAILKRGGKKNEEREEMHEKVLLVMQQISCEENKNNEQ